MQYDLKKKKKKEVDCCGVWAHEILHALGLLNAGINDGRGLAPLEEDCLNVLPISGARGYGFVHRWEPTSSNSDCGWHALTKSASYDDSVGSEPRIPMDHVSNASMILSLPTQSMVRSPESPDDRQHQSPNPQFLHSLLRISNDLYLRETVDRAQLAIAKNEDPVNTAGRSRGNLWRNSLANLVCSPSV